MSATTTSLRHLPLLLLLLAAVSLPAPAQTWTPTSGPYGCIYRLASGGTTLYGADPAGSIFVLDNDGTGWSRRGIDSYQYGITALAASGDSVWAGDYYGRFFRSTDRGLTWKELHDGTDRIAALLIKGDTIFLSHERNGNLENDGTIHRSYDGGATWKTLTPFETGLPGNDILNIVEHDGALLALAINLWRPIYRSTDNGDTWTSIAQHDVRFSTLTAAGGKLYASESTGLYRSEDGGATWERLGREINRFVSSVAVSGDTIIAATWRHETNGMPYRSVDGGKTFSEFPLGNDANNQHALVLQGGSVYMGTQHGVYRTTFGGDSWEPVSRMLNNVRVTDMAYRGDRLHVTTASYGSFAYDGGIHFTSDLGLTWREQGTTLPHRDFLAIAFRESYAVVGGDSGVGISVTWGSWQFKPLEPAQPSVSVLHFTPKGYCLASIRRGAWRANPTLSQWHLAVNGLPNKYAWSFCTQDSTVYVSTDEGLYRSIDEGENWTRVSGSPTGRMNALVADSRDIYAGYEGGVHHSSDRGVSWTFSSNGLSWGGKGVNALVMQGSTVYAGTNDGIFRSTDKGATWNRTDSSLNGIVVTCFAVGPNHLFAGTYGYGVFRTGEVLSAPEQVDVPHLHLLGNHPNPWSGRTTIRFALDVAAEVSISLHDPLGRRVRTLLNERREAGEHSLGIDDSGLTPGVYYYMLRAGERTETGRMIVMGGSSR